MSSMRSAIEEWAAQDLDTMSLDQLGDDLVELELTAGMLEAERARRLRAYGRRRGPGAHGHPSLTAFLIHRCRIAGGRARRLVGLAETSSRCPQVHRAWAEGDISVDQAHRLLEASDGAPGPFADAEPALLDIVTPLGASDTRRALAYWLHTVVDRPDDLDDRRGISLSRTTDGIGRIDGWLTPIAYETLSAALTAYLPPPAPDDPRTPRQRRHDALEDLARDRLDNANTPTVRGEKPHINLICDIPALQGVAGGRHETENGEVVSIQTLRRIACDSSISRIVLGPASEIIDVGRRTRVIPSALRRAVVARDRRCTQIACDRPPRWCDVHHDVHWVDGGPTNPENLRLLCRYHHSEVHRKARRAP